MNLDRFMGTIIMVHGNGRHDYVLVEHIVSWNISACSLQGSLKETGAFTQIVY
jgi:hypothetical protein